MSLPIKKCCKSIVFFVFFTTSCKSSLSTHNISESSISSTWELALVSFSEKKDNEIVKFDESLLSELLKAGWTYSPVNYSCSLITEEDSMHEANNILKLEFMSLFLNYLEPDPIKHKAVNPAGFINYENCVASSKTISAPHSTFWLTLDKPLNDNGHTTLINTKLSIDKFGPTIGHATLIKDVNSNRILKLTIDKLCDTNNCEITKPQNSDSTHLHRMIKIK